LNEEASLPLVLKEIPSDLVHEVIVVDNGSIDRTAEVAEANGARVVKECYQGYGAACLKGIGNVDLASDVVVILDGDYSDYPEDLGRLLEPIAQGHADFVIGSRVLGGAEKGALLWNQRFGNWLACSLMRLLYGTRFTDMGPFRAIRRKSLKILKMNDKTFGWNVEMQAKAIINGVRTIEVPVRYRKRVGKSKISGTIIGTFLAGTMIIGTIFKYYPMYIIRKIRKS
jgi:glycosyltransferase involved in cell wall biosynthesis